MKDIEKLGKATLEMTLFVSKTHTDTNTNIQIDTDTAYTHIDTHTYTETCTYTETRTSQTCAYATRTHRHSDTHRHNTYTHIQIHNTYTVTYLPYIQQCPAKFHPQISDLKVGKLRNLSATIPHAFMVITRQSALQEISLLRIYSFQAYPTPRLAECLSVLTLAIYQNLFLISFSFSSLCQNLRLPLRESCLLGVHCVPHQLQTPGIRRAEANCANLDVK